MKPTIRQRFAIFTPQGFLDGSNAPEIIPMQDFQYTLKLDVEGVLISLQRVIMFNKNGIATLADQLQKFEKEMNVLVGFCDYSEKTYYLVQKVFAGDSIYFSMFESFEAATLFAGTSKVKKNASVLVWHDEKSQRNSIVFELFRRGYNAVAANDEDDYYAKSGQKDKINDLEEKSYLDEETKKAASDVIFDKFLHMTHLGSPGNKIASHVQGNIIIYMLKDYIDANVNEQFDLRYHQKSLIVGFKLFIFDASLALSMNVHGVNFFAKLSTSAAEYGATLCLAGLPDKALQPRLREELEDSGILFFKSLEKLLSDKETISQYSGGVGVNKKNKNLISKALIAKLPVFIKAATYTMDILTNTKPEKEGVSIKELKFEQNNKNLLASSIGFYGGLDGLIVLIFAKDIAKKACQVLLGEDHINDETIRDAMAEFVNIIAGRVKLILLKQDTDISITLPRTFENLEELEYNMEGKKGVLVQLNFDKSPFHLFLTR